MNRNDESDAVSPAENSLGSSESGQNSRERGKIVEQFAVHFRSAPVFHPIIDKLQSDHITQILENAAKHDRDSARSETSERWFRLAYVLLGVGFLVFLSLLLLLEQSDLFLKILQGLGLFLAGGAGGYGLRAYRSCQQ